MKELDYLDTKNYKDLPDDAHQRMVQNSREYILEEKISDLQEEIDRLRSLITAWADSENCDGWHKEPDCECGNSKCGAVIALRKAVGR